MARKPRADPSPTTADPIEIAMEAEAGDTRENSPARTLLIKQARLLDYQLASERMSIGLKALTGLAGVALAVVLALMAFSASQARGVVIEPFQAPPDLAAQGLTGQVLASQIEDRLNRMQAATNPARPQATYSNAWGKAVSVEIPKTGVSLGELQQFLSQQLGHEVRVSGELFRKGEGLTLAVRAAGQPGAEITLGETNLDDLIQRGAEAIYGQTQPYRYGVYLAGLGRTAEARVVLEQLAATGPESERAWALGSLAQYEPDAVRSRALSLQAIDLDPNLAQGWIALSGSESRLGHLEASYQAQKRSLAVMARRDLGGISRDSLSRPNTASNFATFAGDFSGCRREAEKMARMATKPAVRTNALNQIAYCTSLVHEPSAVPALIGGRSDEDLTRALAPTNNGHVELNMNAVYTDRDYAKAVMVLEGTERALRERGPIGQADLNERLMPLKAKMLALSGRIAEAEALVAVMPADCFWCLTARGALAEAKGDRPGWEHWYNESIRQAPSVAWTYGNLAEARRLAGDKDGAIATAREGLKRNPNFADLYVVWGAALLDKGDARGAIRQLEKAQPLTPRWGRMHIIWGEALARTGKPAEARIHWRLAQGLDLSAEDQTRLAADIAGGKH